MVYVHSQVQSLLRLLPYLASQVVVPRNPRFVSRVCLRGGPTGCICRGTFNECCSSRVFYNVFKPDARKYITGSSTPPPPLSFHRVGWLDLLTRLTPGQCIAQKHAFRFDQWWNSTSFYRRLFMSPRTSQLLRVVSPLTEPGVPRLFLVGHITD